jgi:hypothetical protein
VLETDHRVIIPNRGAQKAVSILGRCRNDNLETWKMGEIAYYFDSGSMSS